MITINQVDALEVIKNMPDNSIDLIFCDPPYWTLNKWRGMGTTTRLGGNRKEENRDGSKWFETIDENELFEFMCQCHRVLKNDRHALIMCDGQTLRWILGYAEEADFDYYKPLVWDKVYQGMGYHFRSRHEYIVLLDKGKNRKPKNLGLPDIITIPMIKNNVYPTEKPIELPKLFIEQYTEEGETILDPFCGGGSTIIAAKMLNRNAIGFDSNPEAIKLTKDRLKNIDNYLI